MEETISNKVSAQDIYWNRPAGEEFNMLTFEKVFDTYVVEHVEHVEHARTVNGNVHDTCHDACVAMSIVSNNTEFDVIMKEAIANLFVSDKLRRLFVMVLLQKYAQSKANFIKYAVCMSLDLTTPICQGKTMMALLHQSTFYDMPYDIQQDLLQAIHEMFDENNLEMEAYGLPLPKAPAEAELEREKTKYDIDAITRRLDSVVLNREQKKIVKYIFRHTDNIFIDAPYGREKSFLLDYILGHIRVRKSMIALALAPTGVMAIARGGFTMHGIAKMDIDPDDADRLQYHVPDNSQRAALIRGAHYLIIEEGPNAHRRIWESLDCACRDIRKNRSVSAVFVS
ncbi:helicase [Fragilaria crotonensis]|nr:helicase [Fragilaria crotonensis]